MTTPIGSQVEAELAIERLLDKLEKWIIAQPEAVLIWGQPREVRKRVGEAIAKEMTTIPTREGQPLNRNMRREITRELNRQEREWWKGIRI